MQKYDSRYLPTFGALSLTVLLACTSLSWAAEHGREYLKTDDFGVTQHPSGKLTVISRMFLSKAEKTCASANTPLVLSLEAKDCFHWYMTMVNNGKLKKDYIYYLPMPQPAPDWKNTCLELGYNLYWTSGAGRGVMPPTDIEAKSSNQRCAHINTLSDIATPLLREHWRNEDIKNLRPDRDVFIQNPEVAADRGPKVGPHPLGSKEFHDELRREGIEEPLPPK